MITELAAERVYLAVTHATMPAKLKTVFLNVYSQNY